MKNPQACDSLPVSSWGRAEASPRRLYLMTLSPEYVPPVMTTEVLNGMEQA